LKEDILFNYSTNTESIKCCLIEQTKATLRIDYLFLDMFK